MKPSATPGWQINLVWTQKLAAYWSITWPAWVASWAIGFWFRSSAISIAFFALQAVLAHRLVRKNYRSFRVEVVREDGQQCRRLSMREALRVWLWILGPQLALFLTASLIVWGYSAKLLPDTVRSITSLSLWLQILLVGPYGVDLALRARYPGFRLQAYGYRYG